MSATSILLAAMPHVSPLVADLRAQLGRQAVADAWQAGVTQRLPGHFFAVDGAITVGTPTPAQLLEVFDPLPGDPPLIACVYLAGHVRRVPALPPSAAPATP